MILVDSSIWVENFKNRNLEIQPILEEQSNLIVTHAMIIGEMLLNNRSQNDFLHDLMLLQRIPTLSLQEYIKFVQANAIAGKGIGYVDTNLLASCLKSGTKLWTLDRKLKLVAEEMNCCFLP